MSQLSPITGFKKFVSSDPCFPVSVSYPQELRGPFLDTSNKGYIIARWQGRNADSLRIDIEDLEIAAQRNRRVQLLLGGQTSITALMLELMARVDELGSRYYPRKPWVQDKIIGGREQLIQAKRLVWLKSSQKRFACLTSSREYGGEWVVFLLSRMENVWSTSTTTFDWRAQHRQLWVFKNCHDHDAEVSENVFGAFLSSFRLLPMDSYQNIPSKRDPF
jgi:hypothetical protein